MSIRLIQEHMYQASQHMYQAYEGVLYLSAAQFKLPCVEVQQRPWIFVDMENRLVSS